MRTSSQRRNPLDMIQALDQSGQNDLNQLGTLQSLQANSMMQPQQMRQGDLTNQLLQEQVNSAPAMTQAKMQSEKMRGIGELGTGMSYMDPKMSSDVMQQMLQGEGLYHPDPDAALRAIAAKAGFTLEQLKAAVQQHQHQH